MAGQQRLRQFCRADKIGVDRRFHARCPPQLDEPIRRHFCRQFDPSKAAPPVANSFIENKNPQTHPGSISFGANGVGQGGLKSLLEQDSKPNRPFTSLCKQPVLAAGRRRGLWFQSLFARWVRHANLDKKIIQFLSVELTCATLGSDQILTLFIKRRESQGHTQLSVLPYDALFLGRETSGMKSDPLVQRNKYQNGFYCDAI